MSAQPAVVEGSPGLGDGSKVFNLPEIKAALARENFEVDTRSPEECGALLKSELNKWAKVVKQTNIKVD